MKSCYSWGHKVTGWKYKRAETACNAGWEGLVIKHLVSSTEENMLIKPHVNTSSKYMINIKQCWNYNMMKEPEAILTTGRCFVCVCVCVFLKTCAPNCENWVNVTWAVKTSSATHSERTVNKHFKKTHSHAHVPACTHKHVHRAHNASHSCMNKNKCNMLNECTRQNWWLYCSGLMSGAALLSL